MATQFDPATIEAIVVDANAFPRSLLDLDVLRRWAEEAAAADITLCIPEPVLWELVAHGVEAIEDARSPLQRANRAMRGMGLPPVGDLPAVNSEELVAQVTKTVEQVDGVQLIPCSEDDAIDALRDQILGTGPGKKEKGVRTGASDSAWIRSVRDELDDDSDRYIIVSKDDDVREAFNRWGIEPPLILPSMKDVRTQILKYVDAPRRLSLGLIREVSRAEASAIEAMLDKNAGSQLQRYAEDTFGWLSEPVQIDVQLEDIVCAAGISGQEVDLNARRISGTVHLVADLGLTRWQTDADGELISDYWVVRSAVLSLQVLGHIENDQIVDWKEEDAPRIHPPRNRYWDVVDVIEDCDQALALVPGVEPSGVADTLDDGQWSIAVTDSVELSLDRLSGEASDDWVVEARVGERKLTLECTYDASTWVGGSEGQYMEEPWELTGDGFSPVDRDYPAIALPAFVLDAVLSVEAVG
jgi:hypothetical protein